MKKILILCTTILSLSVFAKNELERINEILNSSKAKPELIKDLRVEAKSNKLAKKLLHELDLYGLIKKREPLIEKEIKPELNKYRKSVIDKIQRNLHGDYLKRLSSQWGECQSGKCLSSKDGVFKYQFPKKEICFPNTTCGFYKCMEEKYQCAKVDSNYFSELAFPTCSKYMKNIQRNYFSKKGIDWIYNVMVCLQKGLVKECDEDGNCDQSTRKDRCEHITKYTLEFHPSCYLNSGVGVCQLPLKDKINIWRTVAKFLTADETTQAFRVVLKCIIP